MPKYKMVSIILATLPSYQLCAKYILYMCDMIPVHNVYHKQFFLTTGPKHPTWPITSSRPGPLNRFIFIKIVKPLFSRHFDFKKFGTMLYFPPAHLYSQRMRTNSYAPEEEFGVTKTTKNKKSSVMITDTR